MSSTKKTPASEKFHSIANEFWEWRLQDAPEFACTVGENRYDDRLQDMSLDAIEQRYKVYKNYQDQLSAISLEELEDRSDQISLRMLRSTLKDLIDNRKWFYHGQCSAIDFLENIIVDYSSYIIPSMKFETSSDFEIYIKRLQTIPKFLQDRQILMDKAIDQKTTPHSVSLRNVPEEFEKVSKSSAEETVFYGPFKDKLPLVSGLTTEERKSLEMKARSVITDEVQPSLLNTANYLREKLLPNCREGLGVTTLKDGDEFYQECLRYHVTVNMTPAEIFELGKKEVARIRSNMEKLVKEVRFEGTLREFIDHMRVDKRFYHDTQEKVLEEFKEVNNYIAPFIPKLIHRIPGIPFQILPMPFHGPGGMYLPSPDGVQPGTFYANLEEPDKRPRFTMMVLSLHEVSPGHHLQISYAQTENLMKFRKDLDLRMSAAPCVHPLFNAYIEGWALYCESLGEEFGIYRDAYDLFGRYSDEIFRACRLVVDPGLHAFGWSWQQAVDYMTDNTCTPVDEIEQEIDRYITWPGQACAYKIGELKIKEIRKNAEEKLSDKFDLRDFHEVVLKVGPMSLDMLEEVVNDWIEKI